MRKTTVSGNRESHRLAHNDAGFTLVEILVASAIMFFVATALFGLVSTSTMLSVTAKADAVAVNAASSFLEQVRRLAYTEVTQARINTLASGASTTIDGVTVSMSATVTPHWFQDQNQSTLYPPYKHVAVTVRATGPVGRPFVLRTGTFVSELRPTGSPPGTPNATGPPGVPEPPLYPATITLTPNTPRGGAVRGSAVPMGMTAVAGGSGVTLNEIEILTSSTGVNPASILFKSGITEPSDSISGQWNTLALNPGGTQRFPDGLYMMRAEALDSRGQVTSFDWNLIVDNNPPEAPTTPVVRSTAGNTSVTFGWDPARDGNWWVPRYSVSWSEQSPVNGTFLAPSSAEVTPPDMDDPIQWTGSTQAFRRYRIDVTSQGPIAEGQTVPFHTSSPVSATFISRPSFTGTVEMIDRGRNNRAATFNISLTSNTPGFHTTAVTNYRWQYRYFIDGQPTTAWINIGITPSTLAALTLNNWSAPLNGEFAGLIGGAPRGWIEFRCLVTVTPNGGALMQIPSSVVRFTRQDSARGHTTRGVDEWTRWETPPTVTPEINWEMWGQ
ncbi:MAG: prepilin-type N-terminal cleavage/methylation domain-containing protein [Actinobacteria bacterium]|nr:prepilin-type N-terminal cleavage/methylation domain-containing protein [Actinomycetota bacterium]